MSTKISHKFIFRLIFISSLLILNFFLIKKFFADNKFEFLPNHDSPNKQKIDLNKDMLLQKINEERAVQNLPKLTENQTLASASAELALLVEADGYNIEKKDYFPKLKEILKKYKYDYAYINHTILLGPLNNDDAVYSWLNDDSEAPQVEAPQMTDNSVASSSSDQNKVDKEYTEIGVYAEIKDTKEFGKVGLIVGVMAKPYEKNESKNEKYDSKAPSTSAKPKVLYVPKTIREIPDDEVVSALNNYRHTHNVRPLNINPNLCQYAEKRVQDLIKFGGLDAHEGFKKDFENKDNLPDPIKNYDGGTIAENLAHQHCKNMTTGDSFYAETGTALIEWCFDSSTKGHREAQLNTVYENVCVRHGQNMYVVIFGD